MKSQEILKSQANPHERALAPKDCCGWKHLEFGMFDGHVLLQWQLCSLSFFYLGNGLDFPLESWLVVADEGNNWRFSMGLLGCDWRLCLLIPVWLTLPRFRSFLCWFSWHSTLRIGTSTHKFCFVLCVCSYIIFLWSESDDHLVQLIFSLFLYLKFLNVLLIRKYNNQI